MDFKIDKGVLVKCKLRKGIVDLPEGIEFIDDEKAFKKSKDITKVILPESLNKFCFGTFVYCNNLKEIDVKSGNPLFCSENGILYDKDKKRLIFFPRGKNVDEYVVEDHVEAIGGGAFQGSTIKKIALQKIKSIGDCAFLGSRLDEIFLPDTLEEIGGDAFNHCRLNEIVIPENVKAIGDFAFSNCPTLKAIVLLCKTPPLLTGAFHCMIPAPVPIIVPKDKLDLYNQSSNWKRQLKNVRGEDL